MKKFALMLAGGGALWAVALSLAGGAAAASGPRADDAINALQGQGYSVHVTGAQTAPLSACTLNNVATSSDSGTAEVSLACPDGC